jgi:hypothetical protein
MSTSEVLTNDRGGVVEANLAVAVSQGRISEGEKDRWRAQYGKAPYETVTQALLSRKPTQVTARPSAAPSFSERQMEDYLRSTFAVKPWQR